MTDIGELCHWRQWFKQGVGVVARDGLLCQAVVQLQFFRACGRFYSDCSTERVKHM